MTLGQFSSCISLYLFIYFLQYGHFFPDPQYENVQHIICCDSYATYAYDFEFANNVGFSRYINIFLFPS